MLVNDDLGAFADLARRMGQGAAETEARILVTLLEANSGNGPTLPDNKGAVPCRSRQQGGERRGNLDATLSAARLALRTRRASTGASSA